MRDLAPSEHAAVLLILAAGEVAPPLAPIVEECGEAAIDGLVSLGLLVRWQSEGGERVTLTAEGAAEIGRQLDTSLSLVDRLEWVTVERVVNGQVERRQEQSEEPYWCTPGSGGSRVHCPVEPGKWVRLERPDLVPDHRQADEPEYLLDEVSEQPIELFRGPDGTGPGIKVRIDKLRRKGAKKPRRRGPKRAG